MPRTPEQAASGLGLALEILECVARQKGPTSAAEIARSLGAARASVYRVLNSLVRDEYLVRRPDFSGFMLGSRLRELAALVEARPLSPIRELLDDVRAATGCVVHLFAFADAGVLIQEEDAHQPVSDPALLITDPTRSAAGHLWLAENSDRPGLCARLGVDTSAIDAIVAAVTARGYAEQAGLLTPDRACLAVPVRYPGEPARAALALVSTVGDLAVAARHVAVLRSAADRLVVLGALVDPRTVS